MVSFIFTMRRHLIRLASTPFILLQFGKDWLCSVCCVQRLATNQNAKFTQGGWNLRYRSVHSNSRTTTTSFNRQRRCLTDKQTAARPSHFRLPSPHLQLPSAFRYQSGQRTIETRVRRTDRHPHLQTHATFSRVIRQRRHSTSFHAILRHVPRVCAS